MNAIEVNYLTKIYRLYNKPKDRLRELISLKRKIFHREFYALRDVSFKVEKGQTVGIIGQNGSGKSTLLKIICGVVQPTSGMVKVNGRFSSILELGAGFHPEFTGRENVYMNGSLMGLSRGQIEERFPEIEAFADIGEYMDQPVKMYSSGMFVRLAFAAAINVDPEILIVDEALSVGDMFFQAKCQERLKKMIDNGLTLLFISHDLTAVKALCQRCILMDHGALANYGSAEEVADSYILGKISGEQIVTEVQTHSLPPPEHYGPSTAEMNKPFRERASFQRLQNGKANFVNIQLLNKDGKETRTVEYQEEVTLRMVLRVNEDLPCLLQAYLIKDKNGIDLVYSDSNMENIKLYSLKKGEEWATDWHFRMALRAGVYGIACSASVPTSNEKFEHCDFITLVLQFEVRPRMNNTLFGLVHWENKVETYRYRVTQ